MITAEQKLEDAWVALIHAAGWTKELCGSPNLSARRRYEAKLDSLAAASADTLRPLIEAAKREKRSHYGEGIEAALQRAIETPRQVGDDTPCT